MDPGSIVRPATSLVSNYQGVTTLKEFLRILLYSTNFMNTTVAESRSGRIEAIDVLRGFTLFGIILVHMVEQYYAGAWPQQYGEATTQTLPDKIASGFVGIFITGKFYMIFSFLFGLSFFIQFSKSDPEKNFLIRFVWRLAILFIVGFIHHLHYRGDILTIYAMLGISMLLFYQLPDKYLLAIAIFLILNIPVLITRGVEALFPTGDANAFGNMDQQTLLNYFNTVKSGSYLEILKANFYEFAGKMQFQIISGRLYITLGLFLLGIYAGRKNLFGKLHENKPLLKKALRCSVYTILGSLVFGLVFFGGTTLLKITLSQQVQWMVGGFIFDLFNTSLAAIYISGLLVLFQKEKWYKRLMVLYPVGRMGLTTYLMQTLFGTLVFFSYGLGLLGDIGAFLLLVLAVMLFGIQILFAQYWFRHFNYGPVEWLWRNATYFKIQPLTLAKTESVPAH